MRAYVISSYLKDVAAELPSRLSDSAPEPGPKPNDVLIDIYAAGLNFFDILQVQGKYQTQPVESFPP